jgi:hypothetical protein
VSCDFLERHFISGEGAASFESHREICAECRALSAELVRLAALTGRLVDPVPGAEVSARWRAIPRVALDCDSASALSAQAIEAPLADADRSRWEGHLRRCAGCRETAEVLGMLPVLRTPETALRPRRPTAPRAESREAAPITDAGAASFEDARRRRAARAAWLDPRLYAAAACLLAGFFAIFSSTLDLRSATQSVSREARVRWAETSDRFQLWEQEASRRLVATRESLTGYTKAAGAIALAAAGRATEGLFHSETTKTEKGNKS